MNTNNIIDYESDFKSFHTLLESMRSDAVINKKVIGILKMDSYSRRIVLNNWLEQLRRNDAQEKLTQNLALLFDNSIAEKVYDLIK